MRLCLVDAFTIMATVHFTTETNDTQQTGATGNVGQSGMPSQTPGPAIGARSQQALATHHDDFDGGAWAKCKAGAKAVGRGLWSAVKGILTNRVTWGLALIGLAVVCPWTIPAIILGVAGAALFAYGTYQNTKETYQLAQDLGLGKGWSVALAGAAALLNIGAAVATVFTFGAAAAFSIKAQAGVHAAVTWIAGKAGAHAAAQFATGEAVKDGALALAGAGLIVLPGGIEMVKDSRRRQPISTNENTVRPPAIDVVAEQEEEENPGETFRGLFARLGIRNLQEANQFFDACQQIETTHGPNLKRINSKVLGGGNLIFKTLFDHPQWVTEAGCEKEDAAVQNAQDAYKTLAIDTLCRRFPNTQRQAIEAAYNDQETTFNYMANAATQSRPGTPTQQLYSQVYAASFDVDNFVEFLTGSSDASIRRQVRAFIDDCRAADFDADRSMAIIRARSAGLTIDQAKVMAAKVFGNNDSEVTKKDLEEFRFKFFPLSSS
jgi:hypothetical protein